jgi:hypothetical protein
MKMRDLPAASLGYFRRRPTASSDWGARRVEPHLRLQPSGVFDTGPRVIVDRAHVRVERLDTDPVLYSKVFKQFESRDGRTYDYRYWAERENFILREFLKRQAEFTHVVQARHLISENDAAKQVLTRDAGITIADWLRVKARYAGGALLAHPFQRADALLRLVRACLIALQEIHAHRIIHCDIKEENICIPYAVAGGRCGMRYGELKLIDFAFSVIDAIPLTQILVIDPEECVPYQSELLIAALRADRQTGSPDAVQRLDCRVDLFSLGYMAEKIAATGLDGTQELRRGFTQLVQRLKAFDTASVPAVLPHPALIAACDRLLARADAPLEFSVEGEWSVEEMVAGPRRKTPLTPVAPPPPTPIGLPRPPSITRARRPRARRVGTGAAGALAVTVLAVAAVLWQQRSSERAPSGAPVGDRPRDAAPLSLATQPGSIQPGATQSVTAQPVTIGAQAAWAQLRGDDDGQFQAAFDQVVRTGDAGDDVRLAALATEYGGTLESQAGQPVRAKALRRLQYMAKAGNVAARKRVAAFEQGYDTAKQQVAVTQWWLHGSGEPPAAAPRWLADGELLAQGGDRPAMLDRAFAKGHGRAVPADRASSIETYLEVMARSTAGDAQSQRIHQSAARGLAAMLDVIVRQKDVDAADRLRERLAAQAMGSPDLEYYLGLISECVARPADLDAARQWFQRAAEDPAWKGAAEDKSRHLGQGCPAA